MMNTKYEFTGETKIVKGVTLHRIRALKSFGEIREGDIGGWIEAERNLSIYDTAWVFGQAQVYGNAFVAEGATVDDRAQIRGNASIYGNAGIYIEGQLGSYFRYTTFFKDNCDNIFVACGCFRGTINEFRRAVKEKHGTTSKQARAYQAAADLAEIQLYQNVPTQDI